MAGVWDTKMKNLMEKSPQAFLEWLIPEAEFEAKEPTRLIRDIEMDSFCTVRIDGKKTGFHVEFQRHEDENMGRRMLEYNVLLTPSHPACRADLAG